MWGPAATGATQGGKTSRNNRCSHKDDALGAHHLEEEGKMAEPMSNYSAEDKPPRHNGKRNEEEGRNPKRQQVTSAGGVKEGPPEKMTFELDLEHK